ncbi:matrix protein [Hapavirus ngaingan]|uniref:Matrix protein n=1 Tax=Hapavirus ngaingan TaxID=1972623 RepID=D3GGL5_9RHAB|nr:matrix protein [Hapavirus ngaingan]ACX83606.1 matrix protein [Hapavirus ngaingan]
MLAHIKKYAKPRSSNSSTGSDTQALWVYQPQQPTEVPFLPETPSAPPIEPRYGPKCFHFEGELEIYTKHAFRSLSELEGVVDSFFDQYNGSYILREPVFLLHGMMSYHVGMRELSTQARKYCSKVGEIISMDLTEDQYTAATSYVYKASYKTRRYGSDFNITICYSLQKSTRRGTPFEIIWNQPMGNGQNPPSLQHWKELIQGN